MTQQRIRSPAAKPHIKSPSYFLSRLLTPDWGPCTNDAPSAFDLRPQTADSAPMTQYHPLFPAADPHKKSAKGGTAPLNW